MLTLVSRCLQTIQKIFTKVMKNQRMQASYNMALMDCVTLNARTVPVAFAPRTISHLVFLINLVLEQTSKDCIGNYEHSNIKVTMSAIVNNFCTLADPNGVQ